MRIEDSIKRQENLENILLEMASSEFSEDALKKTAAKLKDVYSNNFRHSYSKLYPVILEIAKDTNEYNLDYLIETLESLRQLVEKDYFDGEQEFKGLYLPLSKLSDHLNLEIARYNQYTASESVTKDILKQNQNIKQSLESTKEVIEETNQRSTKMQNEYTTILGIFAAIILAFTGTITFSGSVLENIHHASIYRLIIITLLIGFISFNIIAILIDFIVKINGLDLTTDKETAGWLKYNWKIIIFDVIVLAGVVATCLAYKYEWFKNQPIIESTPIVNEQYLDDFSNNEILLPSETKEQASQK